MVKAGNISKHIVHIKIAHIPLSKRLFMNMSSSRRKMYIKLLQIAFETAMVNIGIHKPWYNHKPPVQIYAQFITRKGCDVNMVAWMPFLKAMFEARLLKPNHIALVQAYEVEGRDNVTDLIISAEMSLQKAVDTGRGVLLDEMKLLCQGGKK